MLAATANPIAIPSGAETVVLEWTSDGLKRFFGFTAECPAPVVFRCYINNALKYTARTSSNNPTAYVLDKDFIVPQGQIVSVRAYQTTGFSQNATCTILGG